MVDIPVISAGGPMPQGVAGVRVPAPPQQVANDTAPRDTSTRERSNLSPALRNAPSTEQKVQDGASPRSAAAAVGRIRFELEDGTRVAKFFDTKDVLIYQVPPEGQIFLVKAKESIAEGQVETSA